MAKKWYAYLFKENIYGVGIQAVTFIAGVLFTVIFPNLLGKEGFGYFSLVVGIATLALVFADFGIQLSVLKFLPEGSKKGIAWKYFNLLTEWKVILTAVVSVLLFVSADFIAAEYNMAGDGVRIGAVFLLFYSLMCYLDNVFVAIKRTRDSFAMDGVFHAARIAVPLLLFYLYRPDYIGALLGLAAAAFIAVVPGIIVALREPSLKKAKDGALDMVGLKRYISYGSLGLAATNTIQWSDMLIVGFFMPIADVSVYRVAWLWATATSFLFPFSQRIFLSAHAYEDAERSKIVFDRTLKYGFVFAFLMMAGIILVAGQFLQIVYGAGFSDAYAIMAILSILTIELTLNNLANGLLTGKGDIRTTTHVAVGTAVCQVAALFLLVPSYGLIGAAVGVALVRVLAAVVQATLALRSISLRIPPKYVYKPMLCAAVALALLLPLKEYTYSLPLAIAMGCALVALYGVLAVALRAVDLKEIIGITRGATAK